MANPQDTGNEILKAIFQLDALQRELTPLLPPVSRKLIGELITSGVNPASIARVLGRKPSYVSSFANSKNRSLSPRQIVRVVQFAAAERKKLNDSGKE